MTEARRLSLRSKTALVLVAAALPCAALPIAGPPGALSAFAKYSSQTPSPPLIKAVAPYAVLNEKFKVRYGWTGADSAYSIPLNEKKTLWTFGDTFIGEIKDNRRINAKMINNSIALQNLKDASAPFTFHWGKTLQEPRSMWVTGEAGTYFWPGDGTVIDGKLYMFLHKITADPSKPEPFQFRFITDVILCVENPDDPVELWKSSFHPLANDGQAIQYGTACLSYGKYVYIYCSYERAAKGLDAHPLILARILKEDLSAGKYEAMEYLCDVEKENAWLRQLRDPAILFPDAGPEMSVTAIGGMKGLAAVYMPPLSKAIYLRYARAPEGPWSEPVKLYDCPERDASLGVYSAKTHQELTDGPRELIVTYCRNSNTFSTHMENASIYFPQAIKVSLEKKD